MEKRCRVHRDQPIMLSGVGTPFCPKCRREQHMDIAARLREQNVEAVGSTPAEAAAFWRQDRERWGRVITAAGIKAE